MWHRKLKFYLIGVLLYRKIECGSPIAAWMRLSIVSPSSLKKDKLMVDLDGDPGKRKMEEEAYILAKLSKANRVNLQIG